MTEPNPAGSGTTDRAARKRELAVFFFLTFVMMPALAVAVVGGYGFAVWMYQLMTGPPTGPLG